MEYIAPAGTPIDIKDITFWLSQLSSKQQYPEAMREAVCDKFGVKHCLLMSSGRAAMSLLIPALARLANKPKRNEIIVPGYTCYSVPASIIRAGFKVRICDIDPQTLSYRLDKLQQMDFERVLAITTANLYGIPDDLHAISQIARQNNVYLIDDAAQCMGGRIDGQYSGTFGTVGLLSLDKGKNITTLQGGMLLTNSDELAEILAELIEALPPASATGTLMDSLKLLIYTSLLPPSRYGITQHLPFIKLGQTVYTTDMPVHQYSPSLAIMALRLFGKLDSINQQRRNNAAALKQALENIEGIDFVSSPPQSEAVYARLPILLRDPNQRQRALAELMSQGIGASLSYPLPIADVPELISQIPTEDRDTPGARQVAEQIMTLPSHPYMQPRHVDLTAEILHNILT